MRDFIKDMNIQDNLIRYRWDDWNVEQAEEPIDADWITRLEGLSHRAKIAFTVCSAEWIVHRFALLSDDRLPEQYIEAAWAQIVHWDYGAVTWEEHTADVDWSGPIRGPIGIAMTRVMYAIQRARE